MKRDPILGLQEHYKEALEHFDKNQIVGLFLQGSQNYKLDYEGSDIDTKLVVAPTFEDIARLRKPVSTTHVRANDEHIDFKDVRMYMGEFEKQNINFVEILFTPYFSINQTYKEQWNRLVARREDIARMNPYRAVKSMKGMGAEKFHAMEHYYESKLPVLARFGYDPKQLSHLVRLEDFLGRYIAGETFESCLIPRDCEHIVAIKKGYYDLETARELAKSTMERINQMEKEYCDSHKPLVNQEVKELLEDVQVEIMRIALKESL